MRIKCKICSGELSEFINDIFDDRHGYQGKFNIYRCKICGFGQTYPEIPEDKISEIYTKYYPRKNIINVEMLRNQHLQIMPRLKRWLMGVNNTAHYHIKKGTRVLDIGCGDCTSIMEINAMGAEGYGIEPDLNIKTVVDTLGLRVYIGVFYEMPYPDDFFDYITMSQVLEHIHEPKRLLISLRRILKNHGEIIFSVPNIDSKLRKKYGNRWLNWHVPYHLNHFSKKSLFLLAEKTGYEIKKIKTITPNLWVDLQQKLIDYPIKEGEKVPFFNGGSENNITINKEIEIYKKIIYKKRDLLKFFYFINIIILRINDIFGLGESFLVFMRKRNEYGLCNNSSA